MNEIEKMLKKQNNINTEKEIKVLLKKNLEMTAEVYKMMKKVKSYIFWQQIFGFLKLLIIVIPLIVSAIYLSPLLHKIFEQYNEILKISTEISPKGIVDILDKK